MNYCKLKLYMAAFRCGQITREDMIAAIRKWQASGAII